MRGNTIGRALLACACAALVTASGCLSRGRDAASLRRPTVTSSAAPPATGPADAPGHDFDLDEFLADTINPREEASARESPPEPGLNLWAEPAPDDRPAAGLGVRLRYCWKQDGSIGFPNPDPEANWYGPEVLKVTAGPTRDEVASLARSIDAALDKSPASPAKGITAEGLALAIADGGRLPMRGSRVFVVPPRRIPRPGWTKLTASRYRRYAEVYLSRAEAPPALHGAGRRWRWTKAAKYVSAIPLDDFVQRVEFALLEPGERYGEPPPGGPPVPVLPLGVEDKRDPAYYADSCDVPPEIARLIFPPADDPLGGAGAATRPAGGGMLLIRAAHPPAGSTTLGVVIARVESPAQMDYGGLIRHLPFGGGEARVELEAGTYRLLCPAVQVRGEWHLANPAPVAADGIPLLTVKRGETVTVDLGVAAEPYNPNDPGRKGAMPP